MQHACNAIRLIFFSFGLTLSSWAPLIPLIKHKLNLDDAELGMVLLVFGMGALLTMPLTGFTINKIGSRKVLLFSGLSVAILLPFLVMTQTILGFCITIFLFGSSTGAMNISMNTQSVEIQAACKHPILSGIHSWFSVGGLFGALLVSFLLFIEIPLYGCTLFISLLILLSIVSKWHHLLPPDQLKGQRKTAKFTLPSNQVLFLGGLCFIAFMAEGSMLDWSAEYLRSHLNYTASSAGIGYALFSINMAAGRMIGDQAIKRLGSTQVFQSGCLIAAIGFLIITQITYGYAELIGFCLIGLGGSNVVPILFSSTGKLHDISSSTALTMVTMCGYMGLLLGPAMIGFLAEATNLSIALLSIAFLLSGIGFYGKTAIPETIQ